MNKVILIGAINKGNAPSCGETMKNQLFIKRFNELFDKVISVDTLNWKKRPWILLQLLFHLIFNRGAKVIISASRSASYLISFLYYIRFKKNVYFWVVGGDLELGIKKGIYNLNALAKLNRILVQGKSMAEELKKYGLTNVSYVPNSKPIDFYPSITRETKSEKCKFVFLSRINPNKGISEIVNAATKLNTKYKNKFIIDFYGQIDEHYKNEFFEKISNFDNIEYKGYLDLRNKKGYNTLSKYDVMLFPTYWSGEGFPGVVIDAYIAGLPIIASDWNLNKEVIKNNITGVIIPPYDSQSLQTAMERVINQEINISEIRKNCLDYVQQFDYRKVLSKDLFHELELL